MSPSWSGSRFSVAASCNFPVLVMSILWRGTTTLGALVGGWLGLISSVVMVVLSKAFWVTSLGHKAALFPYDNPAIFSMPIAFAGIIIVSISTRVHVPRRRGPCSTPNTSAPRPASAPSGAHAH